MSNDEWTDGITNERLMRWQRRTTAESASDAPASFSQKSNTSSTLEEAVTGPTSTMGIGAPAPITAMRMRASRVCVDAFLNCPIYI
jgi:hypothetical protein